MNKRIELRVPFGFGESLQECVYRTGSHENVVFGLASHSVLGGATVLYLRHLIPLQESDYLPNDGHGAVWRGSAMFSVMATAMEQGLGILIFHAHDHAGLPGLSRDDLRSADRLIPMFQRRVPSRPHGTVVISRTHASGLLWVPGTRKPQHLTKLRWFGSSILDFDCQQETAAGETPPEYSRQSLVVTPEGQVRLRRAKVAVVGAGGGGSHIIQQLAYLGIGEIVVIDPDVYEDSNRHRLVGGLQADLGIPKVDIFHRLVKRIGLGGRVRRVCAAIPERKAVEALRECDIIVGCVDTLFARSDLQELASRYLLPYVDIGATVRVVSGATVNDPRIAVAGNVFTYIPGSFCLWCCGFLSCKKIEAEQNGPTRGYFEKNMQEAQVVSFNGILASQAVTEVLQLLTGFRGIGLRHADLRVPGASTLRGFKKFDGISGGLQEWGGNRRADCPNCGKVLSAGDVVFESISAGKKGAA
jgi:molybdopterin/thiamine biosynthesis adenylyltransferase